MVLNRTLLGGWLGIVLIALIGVVVAYQFVQPAPPREIVLATGEPNGNYHRYGLKLAQILDKQGVTLTLKSTAGSVENLQMLQAGEVDLALIQGGIEANPGGQQPLALGSLYYEPLWLFTRTSGLQQLRELEGAKLATGLDGSGTQALAGRLLAENGLPLGLAMSSQQAVQALQQGEIDGAMFVAAENSQVIQTLLDDESLTLASLSRGDAYRLRLGYVSNLNLPRGAVDLARDLPPEDVSLLATVAMLVATEELHPALVDLMLLAADEVFSEPGFFHERNQFPSAELIAYPLNPEAKRFFDRGPPFLQRIMPFWAATLIDRLIVMLLPLLALLIPLFKLFPPVYRWRVRSRIYRWYESLKEVDLNLQPGEQCPNAEKLLEQVDAIELEVKQVSTPLSYADELYNLQLHIDLVRKRLHHTAQNQD